jgi:NAD(P)-dependent dehydrogenase (short-subunit alcohol dehydrogenase family)
MASSRLGSSLMASSRVAVVTGANKGIGFGIVRKLAALPGVQVLLTARDESRGRQALKDLGSPTNVRFHQLDISDAASVDSMAGHLRKEFGGLDILVNNAGLAFKGDAFNGDVARQTVRVN